MAERAHSWVPRLLLVSLWFGVLFGLLEAGLLLYVFYFTRIAMWRNGVGPQVIWVAPAVDGVLFLLLGCLVALVFLALPGLRERWLWPVSFAVFSGAAAYGWARSPWAFVPWSCVIFAVGAAVQGFRTGRKMQDSSFGFFYRTLPLFLLVAALGGAGVAIGSEWRERSFLTALPPAPPGRPNVLLIILDTVRADHLSSYGYARPSTPHLDRLAAEGILFERAISTSHWTLPTHVSMLTGALRVAGWYPSPRDDSHPPLLSQTLADEGYATVVCSANKMWFTPKSGFARGFARFNNYYHNVPDRIVRTFYGYQLAEAIRYFWMEVLELPQKRGDRVNAELFEFLDQTRGSGRPFFAVLNYFDVHYPYLAPPPFQGRFSGPGIREKLRPIYRRPIPVRPNLSPAELRLLVDAYDDALAHLDHRLGELRAELERRGQLDQTLIIITADHGEAIGEDGMVGHQPSLRRELLHVPLLVRFPPRVPGGVRVPHPVSLAQIPSTVADVLELAASPYPGRSLLASVIDPHEPVLSLSGGDRSMVSSHWHLIVDDENKAELYDLDQDPAEKNNLAGRPETAALEGQLRAQLKSALQKAGVAPPRSDGS